MTHPAWRFAPRIVTRLRLVLALISGVLAVSLVLALMQMRGLDQTADRLTGESVPVLIATRNIESGLKKLLLSLRDLEAVQSVEEVARMRPLLLQELATLRANVALFEGARGIDDSQRAPDRAGLMLIAVDEIQELTRGTIDFKQQILTAEARVLQQTERVQSMRAVTVALLERITHSNAALTNALMEAQEGGQAEAPPAERFYDALALAIALTELSLQIDSTAELVSRLPFAEDEAALRRAEAGLRQKFRAMAVLIGQIPADAARVDLAREVVAIRNALFGDDNLVQTVADVIVLRGKISRHIADQSGPMQALSGHASLLTNDALSEVEAARGQLQAASEQMLLNMAVTALVSFMVILGAAIFVVERQINRRIAEVTRSVIAIAAGDTAHRINVRGQDELGEVAQALEVFRLNAEELSRSNHELERFAYVAAHDLRSPLRAIQDLTRWTVEDEDTAFSPSGARNMTLLQQRIERMNALLNDLLEYSRVGKEAADLIPLDLGALVQDVSDMLDPEGRFAVTLGSAPVEVTTYATPLRQILLNLVSNAIKHHDRPSGQITITVQASGARLRVSVIDDGPGILPRYHERVFGLFKTLRPRDQVEGSGLGLAIVHKLVTHYGGKVLVASDPEIARGAAFTFDLPLESGLSQPLKAAA